MLQLYRPHKITASAGNPVLAARGPSRDLSKSAEKMGGGGGGVGPCNALQDYASADLFSECRSFVSL